MIGATEALFSLMGVLYMLAFIAAGTLVVARFRTTSTGLLSGGAFFGFALRNLVYNVWSWLAGTNASESFVVVTAAMTIFASLLYVAMTAGIVLIPASLKRLALRAESMPKTF